MKQPRPTTHRARPRTRPRWLASLACVALAQTPAAQSVREHAVLRRIGILCVAAETDTGRLFGLSDPGGFAVGDRVYIEGTPTGFAACGNLAVQLLSNTIEPGFAGLGTLDLSGAIPCLVTDGGGRYELETGGEHPDGARLYVQGIVRPGVAAPRIEEAFLGPGFEAFGRVFPAPGGWRLTARGADGSALEVDLDRMGIVGVAPGDFVFVEGSLARSGQGSGVEVLRRNTTQPAFELAGRLVGSRASGLLFEADGRVFDDLFELEDYGAFGPGDSVFVRGRSLADYDPLEMRRGPSGVAPVRRSRVDRGYQACGRVVGTSSQGTLVQALRGELVRAPHNPRFRVGELVYVAGALRPGSAPLALAHNLMLECWELPGTLQLGFGCSPVFVSDFPAGLAGNVFVLENLAGKQVGERFRVLGGISACEASCSVPCLVANDVIDE